MKRTVSFKSRAAGRNPHRPANVANRRHRAIMAERVYTYVKGWGKGRIRAASSRLGGRLADSPRNIPRYVHDSVDLPQFSQRHFDVAALMFQMLDLLHAFLATDRQRLGAAADTRGE